MPRVSGFGHYDRIGGLIDRGIGAVEIVGRDAVRGHQVDHIAERANEKVSLAKECPQFRPNI